MSALQQAARVYRAMTRSDLPAAHGLSAQLNWPHRLEDWELLHRLFKGFVVCDGERLIGTAFACPQGAFATIGLVVVSPDYQGQGVGRQLMELALEACKPATAILNASAAGAPLYLSQGFIEFGTIEQRQGPARRNRAKACNCALHSIPAECSIVPCNCAKIALRSSPLPALASASCRA